MKKIGGIFLFLLLLLTTATALYLFRLPVASFILSGILEKTGASDVQVKLSQLNSTELIFSRLSCTLPEKGGTVSLQDAILNWTTETLKARQFRNITIDKLTVNLAPGRNSGSETAFSIASLPVQIEHITGILPFRELSVKELILNTKSASIFSGQTISLNLNNKPEANGLKGSLSLAENDLRLVLAAQDSARWQVLLEAPERGQTLLTALLSITNDQLQAEFKTQLERLTLLPSSFIPPLPELSGTLSGKIQFTLKPAVQLELFLQQPAVNTVQAETLQLVLQGELTAPSQFLLAENSSLNISKLRQETTALTELKVGLAGSIEHHNGQWQYTPAPASAILLSGLSTSGRSIESIALTPTISTVFSEKTITLTLSPDWKVQAANIQADPVNLAQVSLHPGKETIITLQTGDVLSWRVAPSVWQLASNEILFNELTLTPDPVQVDFNVLEGKGAHWQTAFSLVSPELALSIPDNALTIRDISSEFTADEDKVEGTVRFEPNSVAGILNMSFSHDLKSGRGKASLSTGEPLQFSETIPLSSLVSSWPLPGDLNGGSLKLQAQAQWQKAQPLNLSLQTELSDGRGQYKNILFSGLASRQNLQILPVLQSKEPGFISITEVDTGLVINDISTKIQLLPSAFGRIPRIELKDMSASLFGGTLYDNYLLVDPQKIEVENTIFLKNIDLSKLITVQSVKGLEISGKIDGTLPYRLDDSGLRITEGSLHNTQAGGTIRYTLPGGGSGMGDSPLTGYALKALEEFHYDVLSATAEYSPDGELQIGLHLEGKSPKLETSRPVHLNITTEQNVLSLLQSLRYSKTLTDEIDKNLQHHSW